MNIPGEFQGSPAMQFVQSRGWDFEVADEQRIRMNECPFCGKHTHPAYVMEIHGSESETKNRDGLYMCHRCGKSGSLISLKQHLGVSIPGVESRKDFAGHEKEIEPLPNIEIAHQALLEDEAAMDYLINGRGFSADVIKRQKIGFAAKRFFRETGEVRAILYPYLVNGNCVFVHYRTLPKMPLSTNNVEKAFNSPKGWDAPLYNGEVLNRPGLKEIVFVEGEANCIAAIDHGFTTICGVPGANFKKADWIDTLDKLEVKIYICYDRDKVGQKAAQKIASRIGVERCWKLLLPSFEYVDPETGDTKQGKDLNEWFVYGGGTAEAFEKLKEEAVLFDVDGVSSATDAVTELYDSISGKQGMEPKYKPKWDSLAKLVGFDDGDVIDIVAEEKIGKTTFGLNIMEDMVDRYGEVGVIICLEMTTIRMARKWVAHVAQIADNIPKTPEQATALKEEFLKGIPFAQDKAGNRPGDLYFCYPRYETTDDIYKLIKDCIRRYGATWIMLDNLQRLADTTSRGNRNRTEHLSTISKVTSQIAKDYSIQMIRIIQPHNIRDGQIAGSRDADGSSQIRKDCDASIALHRNRIGELSRNDFETLPFVEQDAAFDEKMLTAADLSRYSSGGYTTLQYDGAMSTVREFNLSQIAKIKAVANKEVGYSGQLAQLVAPTGLAVATAVVEPVSQEAGAVVI